MKLIATLAVVVALLAGGATAATRSSSTTSDTSTVTVSGNGDVTAVPDQASFSFTVQTKASTAAAALDKNGTDTSAVIAAVEGAGVDKSDIQTAQVSLDPVMSNDGTKILGYTASNTITVSDVPIAKSGSIVDAAVGAGATDVSGPTLSLSSQDALYDQALKAAVANAKEKAQVLAGAAGHNLGDVVTIVEGSNVVAPVPFAQGAAASAAKTPVEAGTQDVQATVTVTYALS
jgi:uncharacterized protein YggE